MSTASCLEKNNLDYAKQGVEPPPCVRAVVFWLLEQSAHLQYLVLKIQLRREEHWMVFTRVM